VKVFGHPRIFGLEIRRLALVGKIARKSVFFRVRQFSVKELNHVHELLKWNETEPASPISTRFGAGNIPRLV